MPAWRRTVRPVPGNPKPFRSRRDAPHGPAALELPPDRAFVLHLGAHAQPPRFVTGRVEHVASGRVAHVGSLRELAIFLRDVLRDEAHAAGLGRGEE